MLNVLPDNTALLTIILALVCAIIDYLALPMMARRNAPPGSDLKAVQKMGRVSITCLTGVYTWMALMFNANDWKVAALVLPAWLVLDASFKLWTISRKIPVAKQ
jgi:hypothetical protein